jgi:hypothetical protein
MYEYTWPSTDASRGSILVGKNLFTQLQCCLPTIALPARFFEGREFGSSSAAYNLTGLISRLLISDRKNLEPESPIQSQLTVDGEVMPIQVFVFKGDRNVRPEHFIGKNGIILSVNGQKHHAYPTTFFGRKSVNLSYIKKHLVAVIDCTDLDAELRDEFFMNSRDRVRPIDFTNRFEEELISFLKNNEALKAINNRRREEEIKNQLADTAPLEDVIRRLLVQSPLLASFFRLGTRVPVPFPDGGGGAGGHSDFVGKATPTYFRFRRGGDSQSRQVHIGQRARLEFETDAEDVYFSRFENPGHRSVVSSEGVAFSGSWGALTNGAITYSLHLPEWATAGDEFQLKIEVGDDALIDSFTCTADIKVLEPAPSSGPGGSGSRRNPNTNPGGSGGLQRIAIPPIYASTHLERDDWSDTTAVEVRMEEGLASEFFYNKDNRSLKSAQAASKMDARVLETRFKFGLVLVGLSIIDWINRQPEQDEEIDIAERVMSVTDAIAPVILPMLEALEGIDSLVGDTEDE